MSSEWINILIEENVQRNNGPFGPWHSTGYPLTIRCARCQRSQPTGKLTYVWDEGWVCK